MVSQDGATDAPTETETMTNAAATISNSPVTTDPEDYGFRCCGNNADWSIGAWHVGPSAVPNMNEGDVYVLEDDESSNYFVARRWYDDEEMGDEIEDLGTFATLEDAAAAALEVVASISR